MIEAIRLGLKENERVMLLAHGRVTLDQKEGNNVAFGWSKRQLMRMVWCDSAMHVISYS